MWIGPLLACAAAYYLADARPAALGIALPILLPSLLGTVILLFGNAFGAQATAYALTGGTGNLVTILISAQISGDALHNPGLGNALALGMVFVMIICIGAYSWLQAKTARWLRT